MIHHAAKVSYFLKKRAKKPKNIKPQNGKYKSLLIKQLQN
jgi:hypothetical protein